MKYFNYHKHSDETNIIVVDSVCTLEQYVDRTLELGHTMISSCEHGTQGNIWKCDDLAKKHGLQWRYVSEAYMVEDRFSKDRTNAHLILAAKTNEGRYAINRALSEANLTGYYYRPRIDLELLLGLNPKDVFVTTACVGGVYQYGWSKAEELIKLFHSHFGDSFALEVQCHNTPKQREVNEFLLRLYRSEGIPLIFGADSHFIHAEDKVLRDLRLQEKGIFYEDEQFWHMDFVDGDTVFERFEQQRVLPKPLIKAAIEQTLIFETFENIVLDKSPKVPTPYPELSQEQANELYLKKLNEAFEIHTASMNEADKAIRREGIDYEANTIVDTNMANYCLLTEAMIRRGKELGGVLTRTGRGSCPSYFTNMLLGVTSIDRFSCPVTMYPDRFISKERLLAGSLPDIDNNVASREPYEQALKQILGEWSVLPMVAYGTLRMASAWKMYCRASNVDFDIANKISDNLKAYETDLKYAEEDEVEIISPFDYVPEQYHSILENSFKFKGIVDSIAPHPCAYLVSNSDLREEIGLVRLKGKDGQPLFAAYIDGGMADRYGYLKQDLLLVDVVDVNNKAYELAGIEQPSASELMELVKNDKAVWDLYAKGYVMGLNQVEQPKTRAKVMLYKPTNFSELSAFVAAVRPSFQSMVDVFLNRKPFSYGIKVLDELLQTEEMPHSFILYQEQLMKILQYGGLDSSESYAAIKAIAKKHPEQVLPIKERFKTNFSAQILKDDNSISQELANKTTEEVWIIIENSCSYLFNSSHAVCVALDSLYGAYAKAHYPLAYYSALITNISNKGDKARAARVRLEAQQAFGIEFSPLRFRQDNRTFAFDETSNTIANTLQSVKFMNQTLADWLYSQKDFKGDWLDMLVLIEEDETCKLNSRQLEILINLNYWEEFGNTEKIKHIYQEFKSGFNRYSKSHKDATKRKRYELLRAWVDGYPIKPVDEAADQLKTIATEIEFMTMPLSKFPNLKGKFAAVEIDTKFSPKVEFYNIATGTLGSMKIKKKTYNDSPIKVGDIVSLQKWKKSQAYSFVDSKPVPKAGVFDLWLESYNIWRP